MRLKEKIRDCFSRGSFPYWLILLADCFTVLLGGYVGRYFEVGGIGFASSFWQYTLGLLICILVFLIAFRLHHTFLGVLRYSSFVDLRRCAYATFNASLVSGLVIWVFEKTGALEGSVVFPGILGIVTMFLVSTLLMWLERIVAKHLYEIICNSAGYRIRAVVYGINYGGVSVVQDLSDLSMAKYDIVAYISPEGDLAPDYVMDKPVLRESPNIVATLRQMEVKAFIVSPYRTSGFRKNDALVNALIDANIRILVVPQPETWDGVSAASWSGIREIDVEDLLPRDKIEVNMAAIGSFLSGRTILVTGAAGSIGSEMARQMATYHPSRLILIDQAETPMHDLRLLMDREYPDLSVKTIVASITDADYMEAVFAGNRPEYVFHAAAYKHVPMMEDNPVEAVRNNIHGTRIIADLSVKYGVRKFVMISSDKAVNPTSVMGCSKRICEMYCQSLNQAVVNRTMKGETQFVITRFGNVLGSSGSVVPIFREQIKRGGPLTVTHPDIVRYFMLISEACKLVLEAGTIGRGGEIFVFDMGSPVKIADLAERMIRLSGVPNLEIQYTGLRDGEKLYEEVLYDSERTLPTGHPKIRVALDRECDYKSVCAGEERLMAATRRFDDTEILRLFKEIVPEYAGGRGL